jgi:hypothetical protein
MVADELPFYTRRWMVWMASRMLMIMNRYNQTGGSNAFLRMFSCAGNGGGDDAWRRRGAGWRSRGRGGGDYRAYDREGYVYLDMFNDDFVTVNDIRLTGAGLESPPTCLGDLNNDGFVNFGDALVIISNCGSMPMDMIQA